MAKLKVKKGLEANLPAVEDGSLLITTDSKKLYLDNGTQRIQVGGDSSSAGTYLFHLLESTSGGITNKDGDFTKLLSAVTNGLCVIARVHDYEDMTYFNDYYFSLGSGSSTAPSTPFQFSRVSTDGILHVISLSSFSDEGISYLTKDLSSTTYIFTKSTTSDNEYSCSASVTDISNTSGTVLGKIRNDSEVSDTYFYRVYNVPASETADGDTVTFVSCDGNVIKKLTSQYSDYGVWHYSEQSLSGGGADANIYTEDGIVKSDGVKFKQSSTADPYTTISKNNNAVEIVANVPTTVTTTTLSKLTLGAQVNGGSQPVTQKLVWDCGGINSSLPALYPVNELGYVNGLGTPSSPWTNANINSLDNTHYVCWKNNSTSIFSSLQIGRDQITPSVIIDSDRVTLKSPNTTVGMSGQQESEILADTSLGATPSGSDFAASRLKLTVRQSGGPVGSGQSKDHSLVFGFTDAVACKFYTSSIVNLGSLDNPWGNLYLGASGGGDIFKKGIDLSNITSGSHNSTLVISNIYGTLPTSTTSTAGGTSYIKFDMNSWYQPSGTTRFTGDGQIIMSTFNNSSQVEVKLYPNVSGSANLLSPSFSSYLGDSANPWFYIYGRSIDAGSLYNHPGLNGSSVNSYRVPVFWGLKTTSTLPTASDGVREGDMCYLVSGTYQVSLRIYYSNVWCTLSTT